MFFEGTDLIFKQSDFRKIKRYFIHNHDRIYNIVWPIMNRIPGCREDIKDINYYIGRPNNTEYSHYDVLMEQFEREDYSLACCTGGGIHIFVVRLMKHAVLILNNRNYKFFEANDTRYRNPIKVFIYELGLAITHEIFHLTEYDKLSPEDFIELMGSNPGDEPYEKAEERAINFSHEFMKKHGNSIIKEIMKI